MKNDWWLLTMKDKIGKWVIRVVNHHWILFRLFSASAWGILFGFTVGLSARNQCWWLFAVSVVCSIVWMVIVCMQAYADRNIWK